MPLADSDTADYRTDAVVIGAGVVGLAIARALALKGLETVLVERADRIGSETSSRNSGVIHAGIYYPPGSLKAETCVRGRALLYDYLASRGLPHSRCGKLIVAADASRRGRLEAIRERARACGVNDLVPLSSRELRELEPEVCGELGLLSPATGIVDAHQFMLSLQGEFEATGGVIAFSTPVVGGQLAVRGEHRVLTGGETAATMGCRVLVNAAGLYARDTWLCLDGGGGRSGPPPQYYAKGHYYAYPGKPPFSRLIYPLPERGGLGVHATLDLAGQVRFGPDVQWIDGIDYRFDTTGQEVFASAVRAYFPGLEPARLQPDYTGIRPKLAGPGEPDGDFGIVTERAHGFPGFFSLHGIESPGLTASLALAEIIAGSL